MRIWELQLAIVVIAVTFVGQSALAVTFDNPVTAYAVNRDNQHLYSIDVESGLATDIGAVGFNDVRAVAFHDDGTLYGVDAETDQLITIDTATGAGTAVAGGGLGVDINEFVGLTFDASLPQQGAAGSLLMLHWSQNIPGAPDPDLWGGALYTLDPSDGSADFLSVLVVPIVGTPILDDEPFITDIASVNPLFGGNTGRTGSDNINPDTGEVGDFIANSFLFDVPAGANLGLTGVNAEPLADFPLGGVVFGVEDITDKMFHQNILSNVEISTVRSSAGESITFDNLAIGPDQTFRGDLSITIAFPFDRAVPEPATAMLGLMGLSALGALARRRVAC